VDRGEGSDSLTRLSMELLVSSRSEADLVSAFDWYREKGTDLGGDFVRCVDATISLIQRSPQIFRKRHGPLRMAMTPRFPYAVYFLWDEEARFVSVRRILHFSQHAPAQFKP
jgi:plasmid stabilization system protein ParE